MLVFRQELLSKKGNLHCLISLSALCPLRISSLTSFLITLHARIQQLGCSQKSNNWVACQNPTIWVMCKNPTIGLFSKIQQFGFVCKNPTFGFACTHWMIQQALPDRSPTASTCIFVTWLWTIVGLRWLHCAALNSRPTEKHSYS